jgi:hypothetical protein
MNDQSDSSRDREREELLERFVLGRMSAAERTAFESRLATDADLRDALRRERDILEGVRLAGRQDLKRRIAAAAAMAARPGVPWGRIAALAAAIMIVTGVALWQRWFYPAPSVAPTAAEIPGKTADAGPDIADRIPSAPRATEPDKAGARDEKRAAPGAGASVPQASREAKQVSPQAAAVGTFERTYRSSGIVLSEGAPGGTRESRMKGDAAARPGQALAKKETPGEADAPEIDAHHYRVESIPDSASLAKADIAAGAADTIRFAVSVRGDSVIIAMPARILGQGRDRLAGARVIRVSPDSVLIDAAGVRIRGYLPLHFLR